MATYSAQTDESALALLGRRMAAFRIRSNWTQAQLAEQAGVSKGTIERIERGDSVQVINLIKVLRVCGMLETFLAVFPDDSPSPMQILQMGKVKARKRVRNPRNNESDASAVTEKPGKYTASDTAPKAKRKHNTPWVWDEDK
jgi:transcriptional regulator with XRE-family HTH domain